MENDPSHLQFPIVDVHQKYSAYKKNDLSHLNIYSLNMTSKLCHNRTHPHFRIRLHIGLSLHEMYKPYQHIHKG